MEINFYHLTRSGVGKTLPKLLEKVLEANLRTVILTPTPEETKVLNESLWTYSPNSFLPHGTHEDGLPDQQPIFITEKMENPNRATVLVQLSPGALSDFQNFTKCLYLFDSNLEGALDKAREAWKIYSQQGHILKYFQQELDGNWTEQKKAG